jgi:glutamate dehydrogenase
MDTAVERFAPGIASLIDRLDQVLIQSDRESFDRAVDHYLDLSIERDLARHLAALPYLSPACEVVAVADEVDTDVTGAAKVYFGLGACLHLGRLHDLIERCAARTLWDRIALAGLYDDLVAQHRRLTIEAFDSARVQLEPETTPDQVEAALEAWLGEAVLGFGRWQRLLAELDGQPGVDLAMLAVAIRQLGSLSGSVASDAA